MQILVRDLIDENRQSSFFVQKPPAPYPHRQGGRHTFVNQSHKRRRNNARRADRSIVLNYLQYRLQIIIYLPFGVPVGARPLLVTFIGHARGKFRPESRKLFMKYLQSTCPAYIIILSISRRARAPINIRYSGGTT